LKAAGYLDCAIHHVLTHIPPERRRELPVDLAEGNLKALSLQGLSQVLNETLIYGLNRYSKVAIMFNIMLGML